MFSQRLMAAIPLRGNRDALLARLRVLQFRALQSLLVENELLADAALIQRQNEICALQKNFAAR